LQRAWAEIDRLRTKIAAVERERERSEDDSHKQVQRPRQPLRPARWMATACAVAALPSKSSPPPLPSPPACPSAVPGANAPSRQRLPISIQSSP
jgi:hypothetical protein